MLLVFEIVFSIPEISRIASIGGGRVGGGWGGQWGQVASQSTHLDSKSSAVPSKSDMN